MQFQQGDLIIKISKPEEWALVHEVTRDIVSIEYTDGPRIGHMATLFGDDLNDFRLVQDNDYTNQLGDSPPPFAPKGGFVPFSQ